MADPQLHQISCGALGASGRNACLALCLAGGGVESELELSFSPLGPSLALLDIETGRVAACGEVEQVATVAVFEPRSNALLLGGGDG